MKYIAPALVLFALLTSPNGQVVRVAKSQVVALFRAGDGDCPHISPRTDRDDTHSMIMMSNGSHLCVAESPETAATELEKP